MENQQDKIKNTGSLTMLEKLQIADPYNLFFTTIPESLETIRQPYSITFTDLLCPSLGKLRSSLQINFVIDITWLIQQYKSQKVGDLPLTIVYGCNNIEGMQEYLDNDVPNVTHHLVIMKDSSGTHHSKIGIYYYEGNFLRIVVSTANLYFADWNMYNQGLWISPALPKLPDTSSDSEGESPTSFKTDLLNYLKTYNISCLTSWIDYVKRADFSEVKVCLVTTTPGKKPKNENRSSHLQRVADLLQKYCELPREMTPEGLRDWKIIAQASTLGCFGATPEEWLESTFLGAVAAHTQCSTITTDLNATINIVFPTKNNVLTSYYGIDGGGCLPYLKGVNKNQKWLKNYLYQWKADHTKRTKAMPHLKTYCRVSPCTNKLAWFLLTSSNISKSAWGGKPRKNGGVYVRSYEVGVMFLPTFFKEDYFHIKNFNNDGRKLFPFMFDIPLTPYRSHDHPFTVKMF